MLDAPGARSLLLSGYGVLRNVQDLRDANDLAVFEAGIVALNISRLRVEPLQGPFDLGRLKLTHRRIFERVYAWAGELRQNTGMMKKVRWPGHAVVYADSAFLQPALDTLFVSLRGETFLRKLPQAEFTVRAAHYYGEIDAIHPFREGNSRTLRQFFSDLALAAGYRLDWTSASATEEDRKRIFLARDLAVMRGDSSLLAEIIGRNLRPFRAS